MVEGVGVSDEQLDQWERLARAATPGPWYVGSGPLMAGVKPEMFGEGRCGYCGTFELLWIGRADINGKMMTAHHHADSNPDVHSVESGDGDLIAGQFDTERGGVVSPEDTVFIAAAREALPALLAEVRASHAREAEQRAATILANKVWAEAAAERDVLQQRIDKALELSEYERDNLLALLKAVSGWGGPSVLSAANTGDWVMQVAGKLNPSGPEEGDWGRPNVSAEGIVRAVNERVAAARAALTATGDSE